MHGIAHGRVDYEGVVGYWIFSQAGPDACFDLSGSIVETGAGE